MKQARGVVPCDSAGETSVLRKGGSSQYVMYGRLPWPLRLGAAAR
jgi:hypothetical protein